ncbi:calcium-activated potassium channel subunit alpha-1-like isoform X2 [Tubulanus polymorphus]|uniref:calcium-activated potassium channel subunit alpha-1-like isoform X2 n=1 Tax=Tubulanus polymorphus TaxID=672921 RepID=UPI003DA2940E
MNSSVSPPTTTPRNPYPDVCKDEKWYYFLASAAISLFGGLFVLLLSECLYYLFRKSACQRKKGDSDDINTCTKGYLRVIRVCEELVACQNFLGKSMTVIHVLSSVGSFVIYIRATTLAEGEYADLERCIKWFKDPWICTDVAFNLYFLVHFIIRFIASRRKAVSWLTTMSIMDHFTIPPMIVGFVLGRDWTGLRFVRAFGLINIAECLQAINLIRTKRSIRIAELLSVFLSVWLVGSGIIHLIENRGDFWAAETHSQDWSFFECVYFLLVTMSTVGYGDYSSNTYLGRLFSILFIISALGMFASFIPELASNITGGAEMFYKRARFNKNFGERHIVVCGHISVQTLKTFMKDLLHQDRVVDKHLKIVVLAGFTPHIELEAVMKRYKLNMVFLQGTVMNVNDLERAKMSDADACIVMSDKYTNDPDAEDASAIMKVIAIKDFESDVRVLVQILQYQNKGYLLTIPGWRPQDGDMAVCLSELKLGFMAQNCLAPGFSTLLANLYTLTSYTDTSSGSRLLCPSGCRSKHKHHHRWQDNYSRSAAFEIYTSYFSKSFQGMTFHEAAEICYNKLDLILIAIDVLCKSKSRASKTVLINPTDEETNIILDTTQGYFVAQDESQVHRVLFYCSSCHKNVRHHTDIGPCRCKGIHMGSKGGNRHQHDMYILGEEHYKARDEDTGVITKSIVVHDELSFSDDGEKKASASPHFPVKIYPTPAEKFTARAKNLLPLAGEFRFFTSRPKLDELNSNSSESGYYDNLPSPVETIDSEASANLSQYDSTGLFHWCPDQDMMSVVLTYAESQAKNFKNHVVLCLFTDESSPLIGLCSFILPLRSATIPTNEIQPVVIIANLEYMAREWTNIMNFPDIYILSTGTGKATMQGSPLSRAYLRAANIFQCGMCVILAGSNQKQGEDQHLSDKEAILCTLNIKTTPKDVQTIHEDDNSERPGELVPTITELNVDSNVQYLDQDDDTENVEIFMSQPYACGRVFTLSLLDSLMSTSYHSDGALAFIRAFITGGVTTQIEQIFAEGCGLYGGEKGAKPKTTGCRNVLLDLKDSIFSDFNQGATFGDLFNYALNRKGVITMGLFRLLDPNSTNNRRYVITNPEKLFKVLPTDKVFCIKPMYPPKKPKFSRVGMDTVT